MSSTRSSRSTPDLPEPRPGFRWGVADGVDDPAELPVTAFDVMPAWKPVGPENPADSGQAASSAKTTPDTGATKKEQP